MTWLEKMDAVLICLDKLSGDNPTFSDLEKWLAENYHNQIDIGEIQDITLYLWREQMMYFEINGLRTSDYDDRLPNGRYLLSCKGKLFKEGVGGFVKQKLNLDAENTRLANLEYHQIRHRNQMIWLTLILAASALATMIYYAVEMYWRYGWFRCP
jgi:hypothetical protein